MWEAELPIDEFFDEMLVAAYESGYLLVVTVIAREADCSEFYSELGTQWASLHDVSGKYVLVAVAGPDARDRMEGGGITDFRREGHLYARSLAVRHLEIRPAAPSGPLNTTQRVPRPLRDIADNQTLSVARLRHHLGIREGEIPCLYVVGLRSQDHRRQVFPISAEGQWSLYRTLKELVEACESDLTKLHRSRARLLELEGQLSRRPRRRSPSRELPRHVAALRAIQHEIDGRPDGTIVRAARKVLDNIAGDSFEREQCFRWTNEARRSGADDQVVRNLKRLIDLRHRGAGPLSLKELDASQLRDQNKRDGADAETVDLDVERYHARRAEREDFSRTWELVLRSITLQSQVSADLRQNSAMIRRPPGRKDGPEVTNIEANAAIRLADVLLVVATDVELDALLACAAETSEVRGPGIVHTQHRSYHDLGRIGDARVLVVQTEMGTSGPGASLATILTAIEDVHPATAIMVGIAFGVDQEKQPIGQVLVSKQVQQYDVQRIGRAQDGSINVVPRGDKVTATPRVLSRLRAAASTQRQIPTEFGLVLSGDKLIDNHDYREALRELEPEAIGGEMEGGGLYVACTEKSVGWCVVKAVCDYADGHKRENKKERQRAAAANAARFVIGALRLGGFTVGRTNPT